MSLSGGMLLSVYAMECKLTDTRSESVASRPVAYALEANRLWCGPRQVSEVHCTRVCPDKKVVLVG